MAKQLEFTDDAGNISLQSYWRLTGVTIDMVAMQARVVFLGYRDKAARDAGLQPLAGARRSYLLDGLVFESAMTAHLSGQKNIMQIAYEMTSGDNLFIGSENV